MRDLPAIFSKVTSRLFPFSSYYLPAKFIGAKIAIPLPKIIILPHLLSVGSVPPTMMAARRRI